MKEEKIKEIDEKEQLIIEAAGVDAVMKARKSGIRRDILLLSIRIDAKKECIKRLENNRCKVKPVKKAPIEEKEEAEEIEEEEEFSLFGSIPGENKSIKKK